VCGDKERPCAPPLPLSKATQQACIAARSSVSLRSAALWSSITFLSLLSTRQKQQASTAQQGAPVSQLAVGRLLSAVVLNDLLELAVYKAEAAGEHSTAAKHLSVSLQ
jgi:hypothetical protein